MDEPDSTELFGVWLKKQDIDKIRALFESYHWNPAVGEKYAIVLEHLLRHKQSQLRAERRTTIDAFIKMVVIGMAIFSAITVSAWIVWQLFFG